jgi:hypothetical protein
MKAAVRWSLGDLFNLIVACALIAWVLSWTCWKLSDRLLLACVELAFLGILGCRSARKPAGHFCGLSVARFTGATLLMAWGPALAIQWWPSAAPRFIDSYGPLWVSLIIALALLVPVGVAGGFVAGQAYLALVDLGEALLRVRSNFVPSHAASSPTVSAVSKPYTHPFHIRRLSVLILRGLCLLIVFGVWWFSAKPIQFACRLPVENPLRRPWALTADGRHIGYLEESGTLRFYETDTGRLVDTVKLSLSAPPARAGHTTWSTLARRMWFLPGGQQLMLDCSPYRYVVVGTDDWRELSSLWNARDGHIIEPVRGISANGRMAVTSPDHANYQLQNNTTLTMWDMTKGTPHRENAIRPSQDLWVMDDIIVVNDEGNAIALQIIRRGPMPGGGVVAWLLDSDRLLSLEYNSFPEAISADGRFVAYFHYVIDTYTGEVQERPGRPIGFAVNGTRLLVEGEERAGRGLPVVSSVATWLLKQRLLLFTGSGSRILGFSRGLPAHDAAQLYRWRLSADGRYAVGVLGESATAELLVFKLP